MELPEKGRRYPTFIHIECALVATIYLNVLHQRAANPTNTTARFGQLPAHDKINLIEILYIASLGTSTLTPVMALDMAI